jgi:hypothetical protein
VAPEEIDASFRSRHRKPIKNAAVFACLGRAPPNPISASASAPTLVDARRRPLRPFPLRSRRASRALLLREAAHACLRGTQYLESRGIEDRGEGPEVSEKPLKSLYGNPMHPFQHSNGIPIRAQRKLRVNEVPPESCAALEVPAYDPSTSPLSVSRLAGSSMRSFRVRGLHPRRSSRVRAARPCPRGADRDR